MKGQRLALQYEVSNKHLHRPSHVVLETRLVFRFVAASAFARLPCEVMQL